MCVALIRVLAFLTNFIFPHQRGELSRLCPPTLSMFGYTVEVGAAATVDVCHQ